MIKENAQVLGDEFLQHYILRTWKVWSLSFWMLYLKFSWDNFSWFYRFKRTHIKKIIYIWFGTDNSIFQMCLVDQIRKYGDSSFQSNSKGLYKDQNDFMNHPEWLFWLCETCLRHILDHPTIENYFLRLFFSIFRIMVLLNHCRMTKNNRQKLDFWSYLTSHIFCSEFKNFCLDVKEDILMGW